MKKDIIFYVATIFTIAGLCIIDLGIGSIFKKPFAGASIGLGLGLAITAFILFNILRRIEAFGKK